MSHDSDRCFRFGRHILYLGVACTIFFPLAGIASSAAAFWNVDGSFRRPREAALFFGVFWACWTILGVWLIFTYARSRLYIGPRGLRQIGCFRARTIDFNELLVARWRIPERDNLMLLGWRIPQGGSLVLQGQDSKLIVYFNFLFSRADWREMMGLLRSMIDEHIQEGWEPFESRVFAPLIQTRKTSQTHLERT